MDQTRWESVLVLFFAGVLAAVQFAKVPPVLGQLGQELALNPAYSGLIVSVVGLVGVLFSVFIVEPINQIGARRALASGLLIGAVCALLEGAAPNITTLLALRFLEGFSQLLIVVAAPTLILRVTAERDRTIGMAIWGTFFAVGFALTNFVAPGILSLSGWRGLFLVHGLALLVSWLACLLLVKPDATTVRPRPELNLGRMLREHAIVYGDRGRALLAVVFLCHTLMFVTLLTFLTLYFRTALGLDQQQIGFWVGTLSVVSLAATFASGVILKLVKRPTLGLVLSFATLSVCGYLVFALRLPQNATLLFSALLLAAAGLIQGFVFASVPLVATTQEEAARANGGISQLGNLGAFLGAPLFGLFTVTGSWSGGAVFLTACCVAGVLCALGLGRHSVATKG